MKKTVLFGLAIVSAGVLAHSSRAAGVTGTSVTGSLTFAGDTTNYFDPNNGQVPPGYLNQSGTTVTIASPAVEFGFADSTDTETANFSAFQFTLESTIIQAPSVSQGALPFTMTFTDTAFAGLQLQQVTDFFPGGLSYSLVGDTITAHWNGGKVTTGDDYTSTFTLAAVPEPSTWSMLGLSILGTGITVLRRRKA